MRGKGTIAQHTEKLIIQMEVEAGRFKFQPAVLQLWEEYRAAHADGYG